MVAVKNPVFMQLNNTIFDIEQKQNSQEMLDYAAGKPTINFLFADEFNELKKATIQSKIDDLKIDFFWSNKVGDYFEETLLDEGNSKPYTLKTQQLNYKIYGGFDLFEDNIDTFILIERYRNKRVKRTPNSGRLFYEFSGSGFKTQINNEASVLDRPTELVLGSVIGKLALNQKKYFKKKNEIITATGIGMTTQGGYSASLHLRFRFKVVINNQIFISKPLQILKMIMAFDSSTAKTIISYKIR